MEQKSVWINRRCFTAEGETMEDADAKLREHLRHVIPILQYEIENNQKTLDGIKEFLH